VGVFSCIPAGAGFGVPLSRRRQGGHRMRGNAQLEAGLRGGAAFGLPCTWSHPPLMRGLQAD
jgi:hypothetical protein